MGKKLHVITSSLDGDVLFKAKCPSCDQTIIASINDKYCPYCADEINVNAITSKKKYKIGKEGYVYCLSCNSVLKVDESKEDKKIIASICFCPNCGSPEITANKDLINDKNPNNKIESAKKKKEENTDSNEENKNQQTKTNQTKPSPTKSFSIGDFIFSYVESPNDAFWFIFDSDGNYIGKIAKSNVSDSLKTLFNKKAFVDAFNSYVNENSLEDAVNEFGVDLAPQPEEESQNEAKAMEILQSSYIPKFYDCLALAIEGSIKGVYQSTLAEIKASFFDELVSVGLTPETAQQVIESSFIEGGSKAFHSLIEKALELLRKPEEAYKEIKATIQKAGYVNITKTITEEDIERKELKARLVNGNIPFSNPEPLTSFVSRKAVEEIRNRIKFK